MFESFTNRAKRTIVLAQAQARELNHNYIGTEHLVLGLLSESANNPNGSIIGRYLELERLTPSQLSDRVLSILGKVDAPLKVQHIPFTPRSKSVLELSLREALDAKHTYVGTEHIFLALLREGEGVAAQVLTKSGVSLGNARDALIGVDRSKCYETEDGMPSARIQH